MLLHHLPAPTLIKTLLLVMISTIIAGCGNHGNDYPDRPIILICPWAAGGGSDRVARQLAVGLEAELGIPVNVVNATGASGVTGHTRGAFARPDGYTITLATAELNMLHWRGLMPITYADFGHGILANRDPAAIFVRKDAEWETLADLTQHLLNNPQRLQASGTALGGIWHVAMAGWLNTIGLEPDSVRWISIEGSTPSLQELMAGGLDFVCCSLPEARSLLEAGEIKALGVMSNQRLEQFQNVPTFKEQGFDIALGTWRGVFLPKEVPEDRAQILIAALESVVQSDSFQTFMNRSGFNWTFETGDGFQESLAQLDHNFGLVLQSEAFSRMGDDIISAKAFPILLGVFCAISFIALLITRQIGLKDSAEKFSKKGLTRIFAIIAAIVFYLLLAESVGFLIIAGTIIVALMTVFNVPWRTTLPVALVSVVLVYHIFAIMLRVPLPRGIIGW